MISKKLQAYRKRNNISQSQAGFPGGPDSKGIMLNEILDALLKSVKPGSFIVIRTDNTTQHFDQKPRLSVVGQQINCSCFDTVILTRHGSHANVVMLVDDTGMIDGKPVNPIATELYHSVCKPATVHAIHGDVALVKDRDFST